MASLTSPVNVLKVIFDLMPPPTLPSLHVKFHSIPQVLQVSSVRAKQGIALTFHVYMGNALLSVTTIICVNAPLDGLVSSKRNSIHPGIRIIEEEPIRYFLLYYSCTEDIDECSPNPCGNNAPCIDSVGEYRCDCTVSITPMMRSDHSVLLPGR